MLRLSLLALIVSAYADVINDGKCPEVKAVENFDMNAYQGTWYEVMKYPCKAEEKSKCVTSEYKLEGDSFKVKNTHVLDGVQSYIEGNAKMAADANKSGKLDVSLKAGDVIKDSPLLVLATDYKKYAIAYNCKYNEKNKNHQVFAWVLSKSKKLEGDAKTAVDNFLKNSKVLDSTKLVNVDFTEEACKFTSSSPMTATTKS